MINETNIAKHFRTEAVNIACYIQNRITIRSILNKTPYELETWKVGAFLLVVSVKWMSFKLLFFLFILTRGG
jgi:hypothetical protein